MGLLLPLLLVLIYPFVVAYRSNLNNGYRTQVNTVAGQEVVLEKSFDDVVLSRPQQARKLERALTRPPTDFPFSLTFMT